MSEIELSEAVEAGALALADAWGVPVTRQERSDARDALTAALPHIERQVREQVAREIEARLSEARLTSAVGRQYGLDEAARVARGDS